MFTQPLRDFAEAAIFAVAAFLIITAANALTILDLPLAIRCPLFGVTFVGWIVGIVGLVIAAINLRFAALGWLKSDDDEPE